MNASALVLLVAWAAATPGPEATATAAASRPAGDETRLAYGPQPPAPARTASRAGDACRSQDSRDIVVCAQRRQPFRVDPNVLEAGRRVESAARSTSAPVPTAQASCSASPMGCGTGLEGLDLANVAVVIGGMAVKAAKGEAWARALKTGGPDEYQLYVQAKEEREAREEKQRAIAAATNARR